MIIDLRREEIHKAQGKDFPFSFGDVSLIYFIPESKNFCLFLLIVCCQSFNGCCG